LTVQFDGVLFFPVTAYDADGRVDIETTTEHVRSRLEFGPGGVFAACGTGEFHALSSTEVRDVVAGTVEAVGGAVPVLSGAGGPLGHAIECARNAADVGADGLLVLPPYLVASNVEGTMAYVEAIAAASPLPVVVYHRGTARFTPEAMVRLAANPKVIGFKDGLGDIGLAQQIVRAVVGTGRDDFAFFNGLLTAELSQAAFRGIGIPLYSSAAFAMAPLVARAYYEAYVSGDEARRLRLLDDFYLPLVALRDQMPGFGVALVKAGVRASGLPVGGVRPPLVDPNAAQLAELERIIAAGLEAVSA
jgi:5-dehydro-4-deoxyglucarate dehydratase